MVRSPDSAPAPDIPGIIREGLFPRTEFRVRRTEFRVHRTELRLRGTGFRAGRTEFGV